MRLSHASLRTLGCRRTTLPSLKLPDFLLPAFVGHPHPRRRYASTTTSTADSATPKPISPPLSRQEREYLDGALRVNHAGELAATLIYTAQIPPLVRAQPQIKSLMKHMYDQEAGHFDTFNKLLAKHRIRPTAMYPVWQVAATVLGWSTGLMGREAAMACTEAVETEIGGHYNEQVRVLLQIIRGREERGEEVGEELRGLLGTVRQCRDEELEHLDHAVDNDARQAEGHGLLTNFIRAGCKGAIWISHRV